MRVKFTLRDSEKAKVSEGQWIIGGHEKDEIGIELFMPLLKDALLILQSSPPMVITSQIAFLFFFFSLSLSFQRRFRNPSDLMRTFAFQPLGPFLEVDGVDMSYEATVGIFFFYFRPHQQPQLDLLTAPSRALRHMLTASCRFTYSEKLRLISHLTHTHTHTHTHTAASKICGGMIAIIISDQLCY